MDYGTMTGWLGGILGSLIGVLGGVFGTYCSIRNTNGPRERAVVVRAAVECWVFVTAFLVLLLGGLFLLPEPYKWYSYLLWLTYPFCLLWGIRRWNTAQQRVRQEESGGAPS